ncbi:MAG: bifunctional riboflavin kinase/FAD synthetase [Firmicutes bacterium]|nr:bifunctional riboflavin kinase/FAD synthetase [Bacillota bacterium]
MKVVQDPQEIGKSYENVMVALGNFDGVHLGHQRLIRDMIQEARQAKGAAVVVTFHPHPLKVLQPDKAPRLLTTLERKIELIRGLEADVLLLVPFTLELARLSPHTFVQDILYDRLQVRKVFVGFNFNFGYRGAGNPELLRTMGGQLGFDVEVLPPITVEGTIVSSTEIRQALELGDILRARTFLGYWPIVEGKVISGDQRGRQIGFPTANVAIDQELMLPGRGVYVAKVKVRGKWYVGVVNIGTKPTFTNLEVWTIEAHLLDFCQTIYGERIELHLLQKLRDECKFNSVNDLVEQIKLDIAEARVLTNTAMFNRAQSR